MWRTPTAQEDFLSCKRLQRVIRCVRTKASLKFNLSSTLPLVNRISLPLDRSGLMSHFSAANLRIERKLRIQVVKGWKLLGRIRRRWNQRPQTPSPCHQFINQDPEYSSAPVASSLLYSQFALSLSLLLHWTPV